MKKWILGKEYDLTDPADRKFLLDRIDGTRVRGAINDQTMIALALADVVIGLLDQVETLEGERDRMIDKGRR